MDITYYNYLISELGLKPKDNSLSSNIHQEILCLQCKEKFIATPKSKVTNFRKYGAKGCPQCTWNTRYNKIDQINIAKLKERFEILSDYGNDNYVDLTVKNKICGHIFTSKKRYLLGRNNGVICPVCNVVKKRKQLLENSEELSKNSLANKKGMPAYKQIVYRLTRVSYRQFKHIINPNDLPRRKSKTGDDGYHLDHIVSVNYCFHNDIPAEVCADYRNLRMIPWKTNAVKWKKPTAKFPEIFYPYVKSALKIDEFVNHVRTSVPVKFEEYKDFGIHTLTLYNDEHKFGILYITLNEYAEQSVGANNHFTKIKTVFDAQDIKVLFIYEDEWKHKSELVIQKIKHIFKLSSAEKIFARKCVIKEVSTRDKGQFLEKYHVQGSIGTEVDLGAYYNDELVAIMTFGRPRTIMNNTAVVQQKGQWELSRFATHNDYHVVGVASKLLAHFENNYNWNMIFSYADRRWSDGNLYHKLGFELEATNKASYFYIVDGERKYRWGYRKDALKENFKEQYDPKLTEYQNMRVFGFDRIWDCGTLKFGKVK